MTLFRKGAPRPLSAHLSAGAADLQHGAALALSLDDPRCPLRPSLRAEAAGLADALRAQPAEPARRAVARAGLDAFDAALDGIAAYQSAKPLRRPAEPPVVWRAGAARLIDYAATAPAPPAEDAPTILALPSLLNPAHILDLSRARSLLRGLARRGARPFLLDWGDPGIEERRFTLGDYVSRRVEPALAALGARTGGGPIALMGHCLAGGLAAAAASRRPDLVSALVLLAAPWDFRALAAAGGPAADPHARATLERLIEACGAVFGGVPPDVLNTLFFLRDPLQAMRKFPGFARARRDSPRGRLFVAVEDWLNDGMRLAAPAARELLIGWLLENALMKGAWRVEGRPATAAQAPQPTLIIASGADTVTPERAALAAKGFAPRADALRPSGGHVGMLIGRRAEAETWDPLAAWLKAHAGRAAAAA